MIIAHDDMMRRAGIEGPVASLEAFLQGTRAPIGAIAASGADPVHLIDAETDAATLRMALRRAGAVEDRYWQIRIAERLLSLEENARVSADLIGWLIEAGETGRARVVHDAVAGGRGPGADRTLDLLLAEGDFDAALSCDDAGGREARIGRAALAAGRWDLAAEMIGAAERDHPDSADVASLVIRQIALRDGPDAAIAALADGQTGLARHSAAARVLRYRLQMDCGRHLETFEELQAKLEQQRDAWGFYWLAEEAAAQCDSLLEFGALLDGTLALYPLQRQMIRQKAGLAATLGDFETTEALLPTIRLFSEWAWHETRVTTACQNAASNVVEDVLSEAAAVSVPRERVNLTVAHYYYYYNGTPEGLERAGDLAAPLARSLSDDPQFQCLRLRLALARGERDAAEQDYDALPGGLARTAALAPFAARFAADAGEHARAAEIWRDHLTCSRAMALNARSAHPETVHLQWHPGQRDVLLFMTVFNGIEFLDWFFDHYRRLGVDHFFVVDNGSTDGSFEWLAAQGDVSLFRQTGSFRQSACGLTWVNHLIRRFGVGHWCFYVDVDEAFVFPGMEIGRTLADLLSYADAQGWRSIPAMMLDIYPEDLSAGAGENPFERSRYIDRDYLSFANEVPPYHFVQGGIRARLSGRSLMMTKAPLVRPDRDFCFLANNHQHSHVPVADLSGALLHYKFIGDLLARVDEAIERDEHFMGARFYKALQSPLRASRGKDVLLSEHTVAYEGPAQLVEMGLMSAPEDSCLLPIGPTSRSR
ncbi:glycosyltransferase family 2 protein [Maritalea mobilis]|uniref:glycosyltransferase family 2 protein n=1 Tax=Maritalea mobilis TaxID=483324 RepID=UPI001C971C9F|nr:glycosyltransferase family 2 protein [Maritalea mobilis]MBY6200998.1 glycosyltransferase family 2 protein [Maritalea mobilis]